jgi:NAD(P)-dependent dehydrogenase (short-subunit alcohol dehydrogenase family)
MSSDVSPVWFITGTSSGFGWSFAEAALERGDRVVATARKPEVLDDLVTKYGDAVLPLQLDVTDRTRVLEAVEEAIAKFGRIDVLINNAGYGLQGAVEEVSEELARAQMETNFFGVLWTTQAVLPQMRSQRSGHILNVSSIGGIAAFPGLGLYHASKWAIEGMGEALAYEVAGFGIKFTSIEPSGFRTKWNNASMQNAEPLPAYDELLSESRKRFGGEGSHTRGNPDLAAGVILDVIDSPNPPLRLLLGNMAYDVAYMRYDERIKTWNEWEEAGRATDDE